MDIHIEITGNNNSVYIVDSGKTNSGKDIMEALFSYIDKQTKIQGHFIDFIEKMQQEQTHKLK